MLKTHLRTKAPGLQIALLVSTTHIFLLYLALSLFSLETLDILLTTLWHHDSYTT